MPLDFTNVTIALESPGDHAWTIARSCGVFAMQGGFALLEAGCVRPANRANIMMKNIADMSFGMVFFLSFGYSFCYSPGNMFIGGFDSAGLGDFDSSADVTTYTLFFSNFAFAATTGTIVSGAVAGRMKFGAYILLSSICMTNLVYPVAVHWVWSSNAWLHDMHFMDFAGTGVVHLVGGSGALLLTLVLGPRSGRFKSSNKLVKYATQRRDKYLEKVNPMKKAAIETKRSQKWKTIQSLGNFAVNDPVNIIYGTFVLTIGWLNFNMSSCLGLSGGRIALTARVGVVTMAGGAFGSVAGMVYSWWDSAGMVRIEPASCGCLAGLVSITGACASMGVWEAALTGFIGGLLACHSSSLLEKWCIDDPVGAVPVHFVGGIWGLLVVGLFAHPPSYGPTTLTGLFHGGGAELLGVQALGALVLIAWTFVSTGLLLVVISLLFGGLRVPIEEEIKGLDKSEHGVGDDEVTRKARKADARARLRQKIGLSSSTKSEPAPASGPYAEGPPKPGDRTETADPGQTSQITRQKSSLSDIAMVITQESAV